MKRSIFLIIALSMLIAVSACSKISGTDVSPAVPSASTDETSSPSGEPEKKVNVNFKTENKSADENGIPVAAVNITYPVVNVNGEQTASTENLNTWAKGFYDTLISYADEVIETARSTYADNPAVFTPFAYDVVIEKKFENEKALMLLVSEVSYLGGAHATNNTYAVCLDMESGSVLMLDSITADRDALVSAVEQNIIQQIKDTNMENELYADYADLIAGGIDNGFWYLDDNGMTVIYNEYMLAPYSAGILHFTVPYEKLDGLIISEWVLK